ncbi:protein ALP [Salix suchowensis]|nr:protein ALP [Salix suchowensis]
MFSGVTATGQHAWAPSSGTLPGSDEDLDAINVGLQGADLEEGSGDSDEHEDINYENYQNSRGVGGEHISSSSNTRSSGKRKQRDVPERRSRKKKSPGIGAQLVSIQQQLLDSISSRKIEKCGLASMTYIKNTAGLEIPSHNHLILNCNSSTFSEDANDDVDDEDAVTFIERKYDADAIILSTAGALTHYYFAYIHKEPCMVSYNTGMRWLNDILRGHWKRCVNMFRMDRDTLLSLCYELETRYGLNPSRRMCVLEKVGMFLFTLAVGASNRHVQERFQRSGETVSRCMKEVLKALCLFAIDIIKPTDPDFTNTPIQIAMNRRFMPHFKNCIGAIDGTHVRATISPELQIPFFGRKGVPTQNIMAACSFDMQFTFVWAGWEGSAHDTRIFLEAIHSTSIQFPKPPEGKYYLVDAGYPNEYGYLGPYRGERYHLEEFRRRGEPSGRREVFNRAHSSLRNVIERTFGVWKQRWKILQCMPPYPYKTQVKIIVASMALNNYIRRRSQHDDVFGEYDRNPDYIPDELLPDVVACETSQSSGRNSRMDIVRESIANSLMGE